MEVIVIAHNIRSTHNVGAILRSCDGFGVQKVYATGYTPYPALPDDARLPHIRAKLTRRIAKSALGAEQTMDVQYTENPATVIRDYQNRGYIIAGLEQSASSVNISRYPAPERLVLLLGEEVHGITPKLLVLCDVTLEIPMHGHKESFNVSVAAGIALYAITTSQKR